MKGFSISSHLRGFKEKYKLDTHVHNSAALLVFT